MTDNEKTVSVDHIAQIAVRNPDIVEAARHYGLTIRTCMPAEVPASVDQPHLLYKNDYFGAPIRNDSDTAWMREQQIEAMYRARFDEQRHAAAGNPSIGERRSTQSSPRAPSLGRTEHRDCDQ